MNQCRCIHASSIFTQSKETPKVKTHTKRFTGVLIINKIINVNPSCYLANNNCYFHKKNKFHDNANVNSHDIIPLIQQINTVQLTRVKDNPFRIW